MHTPHDEASMRAALAKHIFDGFDVEEEAEEYLAGIFLSGNTPPEEKASLLRISLSAASEDWFLHLHHAAARRHSQRGILTDDGLGAGDLLAFIPTGVSHRAARQAEPPNPWAQTDQLIRQLADSLHRQTPAASGPQVGPAGLRAKASGKKHTEPYIRPSAPKVLRSHFWAPSEETSESKEGGGLAVLPEHIGVPYKSPCHPTRPVGQNVGTFPPLIPRQSAVEALGAQYLDHGDGPSSEAPTPLLAQEDVATVAHASRVHGILVRPIDAPRWASARRTPRSPVKSPFFGQSTLPKPGPSPFKTSRPPAGTVSAIPFPPLDAPSFSLIQEALCHEPFWLLIAVTFLIKTSGKLAIPAFHAVQKRFPTPEDLADPTSTPELMDMIRHLGLVVNRTAAVHKYARGWIENPPAPGARYRVKGYDKRDIDLVSMARDRDQEAETYPDGAAEAAADDAWEIGHLTQGKYALDSWRIFCRDELLGRAQDWNGKGALPEFQPEWMRVRPNDKELRACLRWMWMKEGWEWDPVTGDRTALRPEMAAAVNERRVEYDDTGGLRILNEPRAS